MKSIGSTKRGTHGRLVAWSVLLVFGIARGEAAQAAISMSTPRELPLLARVALPFSLAVLEDGSFAVAGVEVIETPRQPSMARLLVQFFAANGEPKNQPLVVDEATDQGFSGRVGSLGNRYLVTWQRFAEHKTLAAFYDQAGTPSTEPFPWTNPEVFSDNNAYLFGPGQGYRILSSTFHQVGVDWLEVPVFQPLLQVFDKEAHALGPPVALGPSRRRTYIYDIAVNGSGRFVVLEDQCLGSFSKLPRHCFNGVQVFDKGGRPRTGLLTQDIPQSLAGRGRVNSLGSVAIDAAGNFLLLWIYDALGRTQHLVARLYDRDGRPLSGVISVRDATSFGLTRPWSLPGGEFLVPSVVFTGPHDLTSLYLQELKTSSQRLLPPVLVTNDIDDEILLLELNSSGHGVVAWITADAQGDRSGGFFKLLSVGGGAARAEDVSTTGEE
jgi:hypothetical protein